MNSELSLSDFDCPTAKVKVRSGALGAFKSAASQCLNSSSPNLPIVRSVAFGHRAIMSSQLSTVMIPIVIAIITAVASYLVGRGMRSHDWQLTLAGERLLERQRLYAKFIAEVDRNGIVTADGDKSIENVMPLIALYSEISLLSTATVQECAKALCDLAVSLNAANEERNTTGHFAAKTAFIEAARGELREIEERGRKRAL